MKKSMKNRLIVGGILSLIVIIIAIFYLKKENEEIIKHSKWMKENYPTLLIKDSLDAKVTAIYKYEGIISYAENPSAVNISCSNGKNMTIFSNKCLTDQEADLDPTIKTGSRLFKLPDSDILTVITNNKEYRFIIQEY